MVGPDTRAADRADCGVLRLKDTFGSGDSGDCPYRLASRLMIWMLREVPPIILCDPKRKGGSPRKVDIVSGFDT